MTKNLIIFIDSLPFNILPQTSFLNQMPEKWSIQPGFGYSINLHAELFAGLLPDDIGYFGEWMYDPPASPGHWLKPILPLLDTIFRPYILNRGLQHILTLSYNPGHPFPNIPLRHLDKFALAGKHIQEATFPRPTLFTEFPHLQALNYRGTGREKGQRDAYLFELGMAAIVENENLFIPLPDLDGLGHTYGIDGQPYLDHLAALDEWCHQLSEKFLDQYPSGHIFVISDHGMVNVTQGVYLDIEEKICRASEKTFLYFSDANLLRVWLFDESLRSDMQTYLDSYGYGQTLNEFDRQTYGLTSPKFGDFIYVLDEKLAFQPSTFARNIPKGMHGYHPQTPSQQGVALHMGTEWPGAKPKRMQNVYSLMHTALSEGW